MPSLHAEERLRLEGGALSAKELKRVVFEATGDIDAAEDAWEKRAHRDMEAEKQTEM